MASKLGLMRKREAVDDRLRSATNRLRARGVDVGSFPEEVRDRDLQEFARLEHTASLLEACCDRIDEFKELETRIEALEATVEPEPAPEATPEPADDKEPADVPVTTTPAPARRGRS